MLVRQSFQSFADPSFAKAPYRLLARMPLKLLRLPLSEKNEGLG